MSSDIDISYPFNFIDVVQEDFNNSLDPFSSCFFSFSSSSSSPTNNHILPLTNSSALDESRVKTEEYCQMSVEDYPNKHHFLSHSCSGDETDQSASKLMQRRSYSCNNFHDKPDFPFEANYHNTLMDSPDFQWHEFNSPENSFFSGQMRRACSAGDLQNMKTIVTHESQTEEANFKVGRYSAEERKEKISKYRAKRSQRKFNKIIKYACRKTLADNRTRIRGRFARNDETNDIPKPQSSKIDEYQQEFWVDLIEGLNDEYLL
ncbi:uncharacterized protein [Cicer arietinum]|uniref:Zinc finger protein CONSTANS-like n=1 Tax=Cicer arietinum TaxID=3827 RepID=A0A1S2YXM1_CICAR|nr:zinc finger protein CONSTANS-like [Cicer arietinum]